MQKVLIINLSAIGDIVSSSVVANTLVKKYGEVNILIKEEIKGLYQGDSGKKIISYEETLKITWDLIVDLTSSNESRKIVVKLKGKEKIGFVNSFLSKIKAFFIYTKSFENDRYYNIVKDYYPMLDYFDKDASKYPKLEAGYDEKIDQLIKNIKRVNVGIHIGANNPKRHIPINIIVELVQFFKEKNINVFLIGQEKEIAAEILNKTENYAVYERFSIKELRYLLSKLDLFIGSDSGMLHMASALGKKCIGIYGPNLSTISGPISENTEFIEKKLTCRPCNQNKECPNNIKCLNLITSKEIIENIKKHI